MQSERIITEARRWLGTPYQHQASCRGIGVDCLGLVRGIFRALYGAEAGPVPAYAPFAERGEPDLLRAAAERHLHPVTGMAQTGHVLLFCLRRGLVPRHLAILSYDQKIIHALSGASVCEIPYRRWWQRHCIGVFAFPPCSSPLNASPLEPVEARVV